MLFRADSAVLCHRCPCNLYTSSGMALGSLLITFPSRRQRFLGFRVAPFQWFFHKEIHASKYSSYVLTTARVISPRQKEKKEPMEPTWRAEPSISTDPKKRPKHTHIQTNELGHLLERRNNNQPTKSQSSSRKRNTTIGSSQAFAPF